MVTNSSFFDRQIDVIDGQKVLFFVFPGFIDLINPADALDHDFVLKFNRHARSTFPIVYCAGTLPALENKKAGQYLSILPASK